MNIGLYISPSHAVPPDENNILAPWMLVGDLVRGLIKREHAVTLFAARGSKTDARLISGGIAPSIRQRTRFEDMETYRSFVTAQELLLFREVIAQAKAGAIDCIHIHQPVERLYPGLAALPPTFPVIITFHDPIRPERFPALEKLMNLGNIHFVSLSKSQQAGVPFPFAGIVPNGVDTKLFCPDQELDLPDRPHLPSGRPLLMTGRIVPQKGFSDAIEIARKIGIRLIIVGQEYEKKKIPREYFENDVKPSIDGKTVIWESVVKQGHLIGHYQTSRALLFPIQWEEPFGLVMIEAMSCGTPVIAYNRGSVSDVVRDGVTGFIIEDVDNHHISTTNNIPWKIKKRGQAGFMEAIKRLGEIDRAACRKHVETHFTLTHMIDRYERLYKHIIDK